MEKNVKITSFAVLVVTIFCCFHCFASSWYDGLPRELLDWGKSVARSPESYGAGQHSKSSGSYSATVSLYENNEGALYLGVVSIPGRGTRVYDEENGQDQALAELNAAIPLEAMDNASTPDSVAFSTGETDEDKAPLVSSETPIASADRAGTRLMTNVVIPKSETKEQQARAAELAAQKPRLIGGTITYEDFEYYNLNGETFEVLAGIEKSFDGCDAGIYVPLSYVDVSGGDWTRMGTTVYVKKTFSRELCDLSVGCNAVFEQTWMDIDGIDDNFAYGAGPMGSVTFLLKGIEVAFGADYLLMGNTEYETVDIVTSGTNIGIPVGKYLVLNFTVYRTDNLDSENDYWTIGGDATCALSDTFSLILGINTVEDLDNFESTAYHLGGTWHY